MDALLMNALTNYDSTDDYWLLKREKDGYELLDDGENNTLTVVGIDGKVKSKTEYADGTDIVRAIMRRTGWETSEISKKLSTAGKIHTPEQDKNMLEANAKIMEKHKLQPFFFRNQVDSGQDWDFKDDENNPEYRPYYWFGDRLVNAENFGNLHYGYVGAAGGFPTGLLIDAPGLPQIKGLKNNSDNTRLGFIFTNFDDPADTMKILQGISAYKSSIGNTLLREITDRLYYQTGAVIVLRGFTFYKYVQTKRELQEKQQ